MNKGKLIGLGIGPGDPELITVKAVEVIKNANVICIPRSKNRDDSIAFEIVKPYIGDTQIVNMVYSMSPEYEARKPYWERHAQTICELSDKGLTIAFVTIGDPCIYSTFAYIMRLVRLKRPPLSIEIIPGITSIAASAAFMQRSIAQAEESLTIQPCSQVIQKSRNWWHDFNCVIIMKIGRKFSRLVDRLNTLELLPGSILISRVGFSNSSIIRGEELVHCSKDIGYLATLFVYPNSEEN